MGIKNRYPRQTVNWDVLACSFCLAPTQKCPTIRPIQFRDWQAIEGVWENVETAPDLMYACGEADRELCSWYQRPSRRILEETKVRRLMQEVTGRQKMLNCGVDFFADFVQIGSFGARW